jgi:hypothetical protein
MATAALVPTTPQRWEVADILRDHAQRLTLSKSQSQAVQDIVACRTDKLGGHLEVCPDVSVRCSQVPPPTLLKTPLGRPRLGADKEAKDGGAAEGWDGGRC